MRWCFHREEAHKHLLLVSSNILSMSRSLEEYQHISFCTVLRREIKLNMHLLRFVVHKLVVAQINVVSNE